MDLNLLSLIVLMIGISVLSFRLTKKIKQSAETDAKLKIANEKIALYRLFVSNTPVKKFFRFIDTVNLEVFDVDIRVMLAKYFDKVLINLSIEHITTLIADIKATKHSMVVMDAFIRANGHYRLNLSGLALTSAIQECDNEKLIIINEFLELLPLELKKEQITTAIKSMQNFLDVDLNDQISSEYKIEMQAALIELQKRVE